MEQHGTWFSLKSSCLKVVKVALKDEDGAQQDWWEQ